MRNQVQALGSRINGRLRSQEGRWDQLVTIAKDPELIAVIGFSAIGLLVSLLIVFAVPISNDAAAILNALP